MPRAFSSFRRSASTPVSAFTSAVLPWSMWPAVPTITGRRSWEGGEEAGLVVEAAQVEDDGAALDAADDRDGGRRAGARPAPRGRRRRARRPALGIVSTGSAPEPIWLAQRPELDREPAERRGDERREARGLRGDLGRRAGEQAQRRQALGEAVGIAVEPQRRLERGEADLVEAQRALQRVAVDARRSGRRGRRRSPPADRRAACRRRR